MSAAHEIRIIGGRFKRSKLPVADRPGLRPTPDRVRETLFNWLGQDLSGWRCIDAFAGAGALGFEAASRGAASVWMIERDGVLATGLRAVKSRLEAQSVRVHTGDGVAALRQAQTGSWDLIFLDPPYDSGLLEPAIAASAQALAPGGLLYVESDTRLDSRLWDPSHCAPQAPPPWQLFRHMKAGQVHAHLLRAATLTGSNAPNPSSAPPDRDEEMTP